jgi:hypothetical protein
MKSTIYWNITLCSLLKVQSTFRRYLSPPSSGSKNKISKKSAWKHVTRLAYSSTWRRRRYVPPKRLLTFNGLHVVIFHKIVLKIISFRSKREESKVSYFLKYFKIEISSNILHWQVENIRFGLAGQTSIPAVPICHLRLSERRIVTRFCSFLGRQHV